MTPLEEIKSTQTIEGVLKSRGIELKNGKACCPFHKDKTPSFSVFEGKWKCFAGCGHGDVVDLLAAFEGKTSGQYLRDLPRNSRSSLPEKPISMPKPLTPQKVTPDAPKRIVATYSYRDANGVEVYQSVRFEPKSFSQRKVSGSGYEWSMAGVERVLYKLPDVRKATEVWIVEGEKDVETLESCGLVATCNVGGAGKWLETYGEHLVGKHVVICGDNDKPGRDHIELVRKMLEKVAKTLRVVKVPDPHKDVTEYLEGMDHDEAVQCLTEMKEKVQPLYHGEPLPLKTMAQLESAYLASFKTDFETALDFSKWLPSLKEAVITPGEMVVIIAETGVGKTTILMDIAMSHPHLRSLLFELELSERKVFERATQRSSGLNRYQIRSKYGTGSRVSWETSGQANNLLISTETGLSLMQIESMVRRSELIFGARPAVVYVDYIQLMGSPKGKTQSRYERFTDIAEGFKRIAKELNVIIVVASQVNRDKEREFGKLRLTDAKDSGAIENSCSLMLGASRNPGLKTEMCVQVLKSTEIGAGISILCHYDFDSLRITEKGQIPT